MHTIEVNPGAIFSCTDGRLYCDIGEVYRLLDHVEGWVHFTHQIPGAVDRQKDWLISQYPDIAAIELPDDMTAEQIMAWFNRMPEVPLGTNYTDPVEPFKELADMMGDK